MKMKSLSFSLLENLDISKLSYHQSVIWLSQVDNWLERDDSPESFIKYQLIKIKLELHKREIRKNMAIKSII